MATDLVVMDPVSHLAVGRQASGAGAFCLLDKPSNRYEMPHALCKSGHLTPRCIDLVGSDLGPDPRRDHRT